MVGEEVELDGGFDAGAVDARRPIPIVVGDGLKSPDAASRRATLETSTSAIFFFEIDEVLEELSCAKAALLREGDEVVEVVGNVAKTEGGQAAGQLTHGCLPRLRPSVS